MRWGADIFGNWRLWSGSVCGVAVVVVVVVVVLVVREVDLR